MSGRLVEIHEAVANQLRQQVARDLSFFAFPDPRRDPPNVQVWPGSPYVEWAGTMSENGRSTLRLRIRVETLNDDAATAGSIMAELLSPGGTTEGSSVFDALHYDRTFAGTVESSVATLGDWDVDPEGYNQVGWVDVEITFKRSGSKV